MAAAPKPEPVPTAVQLDDLHAIVAAEVAARMAEQRDQLDIVLSEWVDDAVKEATKEAIPNKGTELRRLMLHVADQLHNRINVEKSAASYQQAGPHTMAAMAMAETLLRTVAIYVTDDGPGDVVQP